MLTRLGNKTKLAGKLYTHFPPHRLRITLFFGAGGEFFNTPRAKYNVINDLDDNITNLYTVVSEDPDRLIDEILLMPVSKSLLVKFKKEPPADPIKKAAAFLLASNFTYLGKGDSIRYGVGNEKELLIKNIKKTFLQLGDARIMNEDFRNVIKKISFSSTVLKRNEAFIYMDPVYLDTDHYYKVPKWTEKDTFDCFEIMEKEGIRAAMSEFRHPFVISEAERRGFNIIPIKNRKNILNRKEEILITNYESNTLF